MNYQIEEYYAKLGGRERWHAEYTAQAVHATEGFLVLTQPDGERIFLPSDRAYRVVRISGSEGR